MTVEMHQGNNTDQPQGHNHRKSDGSYCSLKQGQGTTRGCDIKSFSQGDVKSFVCTHSCTAEVLVNCAAVLPTFCYAVSVAALCSCPQTSTAAGTARTLLG